jgi:NAD(P)-dependent dehydrogenase (short-subunit alcohol dehydrogenase family)
MTNNERISFEGQVVVVTGVGRGLGRAHVLDLARRGARVVANDVSAEHADAVVAEVEAAGGTAVASHDSVGTPEGGRAIVELALERFGTVDAVIHNAGTFQYANFEDLSVDQITETIDVHLKGAFWVTQPAFPVMRDKGYGRVLLTSSSAGAFGMGGLANYAAAKAGLIGLGKAIAVEGAEFGILSNCVLPYGNAPWRGAAAHASRGKGVYEDHSVLSPRMDPATVSPLVSYLASSACQVTGEAFSALAGRFARVFVGLTPGFFSDSAEPVEAEEIAARFEQIRNPEDYWIPESLVAEQRSVADLIRG